MLSVEQLALDFASLFSEEGTNKSVLVAGQALALWGVYYLSPSIPLEQLSPLTSRDIDFYNARTSDVKKYAELVVDYLKENNLKLTEEYPSADRHTNNVGIWQITDVASNESVIVDFLNYLSGIKQHEVEKPENIEKMTIGQYTFQILSPTICLKARISNLLDLYPAIKSAEKIANEKERVKLAVKIVHQHLLEVAAIDMRHAYNRAKQILEIAKSRLGKRLFKQENISVLDAIPKGIFNENFYNFCLKDASEKMGKKLPQKNDN